MSRDVKALFNIDESESIGSVVKVDSYSVTVLIPSDEVLKNVNVNSYVLLHTSNPNIRLVGRIDRIIQTEESDEYEEGQIVSKILSKNIAHINALGTLKGPGGGRENTTFSRAVEILPEISAKCFSLKGEELSMFASLISNTLAEVDTPLNIGYYTMAANATAILDGDAFFKRHAMIVGSTGAGKSWTVAHLVEQAANLPSSNLVLLDLHGEYTPLGENKNVACYKIAGPSDLDDEKSNAIYLPYWLLGYEDMLALILDRSDDNAPNQAMAFSKLVLEAKRKYLIKNDMTKELETFTIDSPVPYDMNFVVEQLEELNIQRVKNATGKEVNGPFNGKFNRFIPRLKAKLADRRYGFLFELKDSQQQVEYLKTIVSNFMQTSNEEKKGIKVVDFSEVPSDILPVVISLVAKLIFQTQQWTKKENRYPISLMCDEAHLYLPVSKSADASAGRALSHFERIAKEGRKYGVSLTIISQRPSELNTTIMSQCNNIISLRLTNQADKSAVSNLLPENLGGIKDVLPALGIGEGIIVGDACLLPSRVKIQEPKCKPESSSVNFWTEWNKKDVEIQQDLSKSVDNMIRQTME
ncbi:ATP-binding protein [Pontibacillus salipaludis]|uniref:ATP-binding protein n=1 Tax=Pontibacillus salipaludis TaxID=1697394 RepID=UPI0031E9B0F9